MNSSRGKEKPNTLIITKFSKKISQLKWKQIYKIIVDLAGLIILCKNLFP